MPNVWVPGNLRFYQWCASCANPRCPGKYYQVSVLLGIHILVGRN